LDEDFFWKRKIYLKFYFNFLHAPNITFFIIRACNDQNREANIPFKEYCGFFFAKTLFEQKIPVNEHSQITSFTFQCAKIRVKHDFDIEMKQKVMASFCFDIESKRNLRP
jgi:hypothetical protein